MRKFIDISGKDFGRISVLKLYERKDNQIYWKCKCSCGTIKIINGSSLRSGKTKSCGCLNKEISSFKNTIDLTGSKFGKLLVISIAKIKRRGIGSCIFWTCQCDCGNIKDISGQALKKGSTVSCGCYNKEKTSKRFLEDLTGKTFGNLKIVNRVERPKEKSSGTYWSCICDCGNKILLPSSTIKRKKSCGCIKNNKERIYLLAKGEASFNNLYKRYKNDASNKNIKFEIDKKSFKEITQKNCFYCGSEPCQIIIATGNNGDYIYNGIDRINNSGKYSMDNIVPCCKKCNFAKRNMDINEYFDFIKMSYNNLKLKNLILTI